MNELFQRRGHWVLSLDLIPNGQEAAGKRPLEQKEGSYQPGV